LCAVPNEVALNKEAQRLEFLGIKYIIFKEPDIGNQATAAATEPIDINTRKKLKRLKLWTADKCCIEST